MAVRRVTAMAIAAVSVLAACASEPAARTPAATSATKPRPEDPFGNGESGRWRVDRYGVTLTLPNAAAWRFEDSGPWSLAVEARTRTTIRVRRYEETSLVGRHECEVRAELDGALPTELGTTRGAGTRRAFEVMVDEPVRRPRGWDGRHIDALESAAGPGLSGHVFLLAGLHHSCLVIHGQTEVAGDPDVAQLADRMEALWQSLSRTTVDRAAAPEDPLLPTVPLPP